MFLAESPYKELTDYLSQKSDGELTRIFDKYIPSYNLCEEFEKLDKDKKASYLALLLHNARTVKHEKELEALIEKTIENVKREKRMQERIKSGVMY